MHILYIVPKCNRLLRKLMTRFNFCLIDCIDHTVSIVVGRFDECFFLLWLLNQQRNFLITVGEDEQISPQLSAMCLKVFDLDKMQPEGSSTTSPDCIQILRIFTNQFPEAKVTLVNNPFVLTHMISLSLDLRYSHWEKFVLVNLLGNYLVTCSSSYLKEI